MSTRGRWLWPLLGLAVAAVASQAPRALGVDRQRKSASPVEARAERDRDVDRDRDRDREPDRDRDRDRGPGREVPRDRDRPDGEGLEEGMPEMRAVPGGRIRPWPLTWRLGVYAVNTPTGVRVTRVLPGSPAWRVGLEHGDVIVTVDGYQVGYVRGRLYPLGEELQRRAGPRGDVLLMVQDVRTDRLLNLDITLERYPRPFEPQPLPATPREDKAER